MAGTKYMPHNPRTAAVLIQFVRQMKADASPDWDDSLDVSDNWIRICEHERECTKTLIRELKRLDWENHELRQLVVHHLQAQGEEFLTALDNSYQDQSVSQAIAGLDTDRS